MFWTRAATSLLQTLFNTLSLWHEHADKIYSQRAWTPSRDGCKYRRWHAYIRVVMHTFWLEPCTRVTDHIWQLSLISCTQYEHVHCIIGLRCSVNMYWTAHPSLCGAEKVNLVEKTLLMFHNGTRWDEGLLSESVWFLRSVLAKNVCCFNWGPCIFIMAIFA